MNKDYKQQSKKVADYYNKWQHGYNAVYGDTIQAFRPTEKDDLMKYIAVSAGIRNGMKILDAGCGVCGPATWLAENFDINVSGITVSDTQMVQAKEIIDRKNLTSKISITQGDYHELENYFNQKSFDCVLFLESLGHSGNPAKAIAKAYEVLKPDGGIYIKDFYYKEPADEFWRARIGRTVANINRLYSYNTLNLNQTLSALRAVKFEIEFIRKFSFNDDISIRQEFESRFSIDIFDGEPEFYPAEWLEIKCLKPKV